jgi:hypothetical protein
MDTLVAREFDHDKCLWRMDCQQHHELQSTTDKRHLRELQINERSAVITGSHDLAPSSECTPSAANGQVSGCSSITCRISFISCRIRLIVGERMFTEEGILSNCRPSPI